MKTPHTLILTLAIAGAALAAPTLASADTYCVNASGDCPTGGQTINDLQLAMNTAADHPGADEIRLGEKGSPYFGPFVYQPLSRGAEPLTLKGVSGRPALTGPSNAVTVLTVKDTTLEGVDIETDFGEGQALDAKDSALRGVNLLGPSSSAPDLRGIRATGAVTVEDTQVKGGYAVALSVTGGAISETASSRVTARRLQIESGDGGVSVGEGGSLTLSDSRVRALSEAILSRGSAEISRSVLETTRPGSVGLAQLSATGGFALDHVTVAHRGVPDGTDSALRLNTQEPNVETRVHAVGLAGYTRGFQRVTINGLAHPVKVTDSVWDAARDELGGPGAGAFVESGNAHLAPALVDLAGGDLRPSAGSALIDRDLSDVSQYADLDGSPALDGNGDGIVRPDAGALEFRPTAPAPAPPAPAGGGSSAGSGGGVVGGASAPSADLTAPVLTKLGLRAGRRVAGAATLTLGRAAKLRLVFAASEAATIKVVPRPVVAGRLAKAPGAITGKVEAGNGSIALGKRLRRLGALRPGQLRLFVTATDAAGNRSAKRELKLRLRK
jgi:hypothetical protein